MSDRKRLPLTALEAFVAVAARSSFRRAAEDIGISQSALTRHVQNLERDLATVLFRRGNNRIALTDAGASLDRDVSAALDRVRRAVEAAATNRQILRVSVLPSFVLHWLTPRLPLFHAAHPAIDIQLEPDHRVVDLGAAEADVAIRYGTGKWPGCVSDLIMTEHLSPVAAPDSLPATPSLEEALRRSVLLDAAKPFEWTALLSRLDMTPTTRKRVADYNLVLGAAVAGQGIAAGRRSMIAPLLTSGELVRLIPHWLDCGTGHYVVVHPDRAADRPVGAFRHWLVARGRAQNDERRQEASPVH